MQTDEKTFTYSNPRSEEELLLKNMGLVHSIAARFPYSGVEYEDLVQIGSLGLLKAILTNQKVLRFPLMPCPL